MKLFRFSCTVLLLCLASLLLNAYAEIGCSPSEEDVQAIYVHGVTLRNKDPKSFFNPASFQKDADRMNQALSRYRYFGCQLKKDLAVTIPWGIYPEGNYLPSDNVDKGSFAAFSHSANGKFNGVSSVLNPISSTVNSVFHNFAYDMQWQLGRNDDQDKLFKYFDEQLNPHRTSSYIIFAHSAGSPLVFRRILGEYEIQEFKNYGRKANDLNTDATRKYANLKGIVVFGSPTSTFTGKLLGTCDPALKHSSALKEVETHCALSPAVRKFLDEGKFLINVSHVQDFVSIPWFAPSILPRLSNGFDTFFFNYPKQQPLLFSKYPQFRVLMWRPAFVPTEQLPVVALGAFATSHSRYWKSPKRFSGFLHTQIPEQSVK